PQCDSGLSDSLPTIAVPTLVLVGAEDRHFLGAADYMAAKIPGARKIVIPGAGHAANLDQPAAFNRAPALLPPPPPSRAGGGVGERSPATLPVTRDRPPAILATSFLSLKQPR